MADHLSEEEWNESFEQMVNGSESPNKEVFDKLFSANFEDEDILFELATREDYPKIVLNFENYCDLKTRAQNVHFDYVSGLILLMQKLSQLKSSLDTEILQLWFTSQRQSENCVVTKVFEHLPHCYLELCLPQFIDLNAYSFADMLNSQPFDAVSVAQQVRPKAINLYILCTFFNQLNQSIDSDISFFEHLTLHMCQFVSALVPELFHHIEQVLFKYLLSEQSVCQILASDVLCFTARLSKDPLGYQLCNNLMIIGNHLDDTRLPNVTSLLNRLLPFLHNNELEYLFKDYDLFSYSRLWRFLDINRVLNECQIKEIIQKLLVFIEEGKPLIMYCLEVIRNIFTSDDIDSKTRNHFFLLFSENFFDSIDPELDARLISLMTVLMSQELNDHFVDKLFDKFDKISFGSDSFETYLKFFTRLAQTKTSYAAEKRLSILISRIITSIFDNSYNFYEKFNVFKALENISTKTKNIGITVLQECLGNSTLRQEFRAYLKKIDSFQKRGERMSVDDKIRYLQSLVSKLLSQKDFITSGIRCRQITTSLSQTSASVEHKQNGSLNGAECQQSPSDGRIDVSIQDFQQSLNRLKEQSVFSRQQKAKINAIYNDFNDFVFKIND